MFIKMNIKESTAFVPGRSGNSRTVRKYEAKPVEPQKIQHGNLMKRSQRKNGNLPASNLSSVPWGLPTQSGAQTSSSGNITSETESYVVLAVTVGRGQAQCEVGIAAIDILHPTLIVCQISDTLSYIKTLTKINILNPHEIVMPMSIANDRRENRLVDKIKQRFAHITLTAFARGAFNADNGWKNICDLSTPDCNAVALIVQHRYYALCAASATLTYSERKLCKYFARNSVKVEYQEAEKHLIIDISLSNLLELVAPAKPSGRTRFSSLFAILNNCVTSLGSRTLRSDILHPPSAITEIEERLNAVEELIKSPRMLFDVRDILSKAQQIHRILTLPTILPESAINISETQLNYLVLLKTVLEQIEPLKDALKDAKQPLFIQIQEILLHEDFNIIKETINRVLHVDAKVAKGGNARMQRCFAIKAGVDGLLDYVRKSYSENIDQLREYVASLANKYGLPLSLGNNYTRGYHIVYPLNKHQRQTIAKSDLPGEFVNVFRMATCFHIKTDELINLSTVIEDLSEDILKHSNKVIRDTLVAIKGHISIFYTLCENIAKLDVLQSLAQASAGNNYVRPTFNKYMEIIEGRHPLLEFVLVREPVPNDVSCSEEYNMHIITGPNGAGKSIFIRQIALIQIMAQVGCYVPAASAVLRVADRIFGRLSLNDNLDAGMSSFHLEMAEMKYCLDNITNDSLVIIDELGRSTSVVQGTGIAMMILEKLLKTKAFTFATTHFTALTKLRDMYCNVKIWQLETIQEGKDFKTMILDMKHNVIPGCINLKRYSIYWVRGIWPDRIVNEMIKKLDEMETDKQVTCCAPISPKQRLLYDVRAEMNLMKRKKQLTSSAVNTLLNKHMHELHKYKIPVIWDGLTSNSSNSPSAPPFGRSFTLGNPPCDLTFSASNHYHEINNFINETLGNVRLLEPQVAIFSDSHVSSPMFNTNKPVKDPTPSFSFAPQQLGDFDNADESQTSYLTFSQSSYHSAVDHVQDDNIFTKPFPVTKKSTDSSTITKEKLKSIVPHKTSTPILIPNQSHSTDVTEEEMQSIIEELERSEDWAADWERTNQYVSKSNTSHTSESICYSPLCSSPDRKQCEAESPNGYNTNSKTAILSSGTSNPKTTEGSSSDLDPSAQVKKSSGSIRTNLKRKPKFRMTPKIRPKLMPYRETTKQTFKLPKLTKRQIEEEFDKQRQELYENFDPNNTTMLEKFLARPSVKQIQQAKPVALIRRTKDGVIVIPPAPKKVKKSKYDYEPSKFGQKSRIDMSIFSDRCESQFEKLMSGKSEKKQLQETYSLFSATKGDRQVIFYQKQKIITATTSSEGQTT